jgi:energy-coupling factor transporter ATP-binding protein EcfA2
MRIHRLHLSDFRGTAARDVVFADEGVTVVQGPNEAGKSSLAEALDLLLEHYDDSKKAAVRAVKPVHRDVGSLVEAEISAGPYRFTYRKRFHRQTMTELTVHEPAPEHRTGREAHERVRAILAETVDLQLWQALRIVQGQPVAQPELGEVGALAAALDLAAGGAGAPGGEREQSVFQRALDEYGRYFTPTGQENAGVKGLRAEAEATAAAVAEAAAALAALERDVERAAAVAADLDGLAAEHRAHGTRLRELERRWAEISQRQSAVDRLALQAERAADALRRATEAAGRRAGLIGAAEQSAAAAREAHEELATVAPEAEAASAAAGTAQAEAARLRAELEAAREALRAAQDAEARSRDAFSLVLLEERRARIAAARAGAADAQAVLAGTAITAADVERIEAAQLEAVSVRGTLQEQGPVLRLRAARAIAVELDGAPVALTAGEPHVVPVADEVVLRLDGLEAVVSPGRSVGALQAEAAEAEQRLRQACAAVGVADVAAAREALRRRQDALRTVELAEQAVRENLRDLTFEELAGKIERLRARVTDGGPADVDGARDALRRAAEAVEGLELAHDAADRAATAAAERRAALHQRVAALTLRAEAAAAERDAAERALLQDRTTLADDDVRAQIDEATADAEGALAALQTARAALDAEDPGSLEAELENAQALAEKQRQQLRHLQDEQAKLQGRLSALGESGLHDRLSLAQARHERASLAWRQAQRGAAAARLLHDTLLRHREAARRAYAAPLRDKIESLGRIVFGADFAVELADDLRITRRTLGGVTLDVEQLSEGAKEQLAVLTRLAVAAITSADGGVPLVLDDALGWSDPARLERMGAAFHVAARDCQIIVLTCMPERYAAIGSATLVDLTTP